MLNKLSTACIATTIAISGILGTTQKAEAILAGFYEFNDAGNLGLDSSANGNDGNNSGAVFDASGFSGGAASFDGLSSFIRVQIDPNPAVFPQMTWGAWVKPSLTDGIRTVLTGDNAGFDRGITLDDRVSGNWGAFTGNGVLDSGISPSTTEWTFVAAVYDESSNSLTYHVNDTSSSTTTNFNASNNFFDIGRNPDFNENFAGLIDNVFIFDEALSPAEINAIRINGTAAVPFEFSPSLGLFIVCGLLGSTHLYRKYQELVFEKSNC